MNRRSFLRFLGLAPVAAAVGSAAAEPMRLASGGHVDLGAADLKPFRAFQCCHPVASCVKGPIIVGDPFVRVPDSRAARQAARDSFARLRLEYSR